MNDVTRLQKAIRDLHGLNAEHVESVPVNETFEGQTLWEGDVEVYRVRGHPQATHAYAWSYRSDDGELRHVAVLGVPPINGAVDAVRASIAALSKPQKRARQIQESIRRVLIDDWDPIGVNDIPEAQDEYDSYVAGVYRLLVSGATEQQITDHLWRIEIDTIGLPAVNPDRLLPVARKLRALDVRL